MIHPLQHIEGIVKLPRQFNNPFFYEPDDYCRRAMSEVVSYLKNDPDQNFSTYDVPSTFREEIAMGKMFGVLLVECEGQIGYLAGYSGQILGRSDWEGFVPAVFDYLQENGVFKREEREIVRINEQVSVLETADIEPEEQPDDPRPELYKTKREGEDDEAYRRRRQFENAELHRWKLRERARQEQKNAVKRQKKDEIQALKTLRRQKSDQLQTWLFRHFVMRNARGEERNLLDIFGAGTMPPAGSGECCEPKMLQYALAHGLRPVSMAMFWWGKSPRSEVRHHLQTYPACHSKCRPILRWMLQGMDVAPNPLEQEREQQLEIIGEDDAICVVCKPAGMLAVPGKSGRTNVLQLMRQRYPYATGPMIVHRLDMDTSGLMVVAKTLEAYIALQRQFVQHEVCKRYVALLSAPLLSEQGVISLPLRPDLDDRPRQVVDYQYGKAAETRYVRVDERRVALFPHTGRTHQLRMHCAHHDGLGNPILGDPLYGERQDQLYLHAESITFSHPVTGEKVTFTAPAPF